MQSDRPVHMANQTGKLFVTLDKSKAFEAIAEHLSKLWNPAVRAQVGASFAGGVNGFDPFVRQVAGTTYRSTRGTLHRCS